jgi:hypothetical protein
MGETNLAQDITMKDVQHLWRARVRVAARGDEGLWLRPRIRTTDGGWPGSDGTRAKPLDWHN